MVTRPLEEYVVLPTASLLEVAKVIDENTSRTALIVDAHETKKLIGVVSEGDILRALLRGTDVHAPVQDIMQVNFQYVQSFDVEHVRPVFAKRGFGLIPVVDDAMHVLGVITLLDCIQAK